METVRCTWCGMKASQIVVRNSDGKRIPSCKTCVPTAMILQWDRSRERIQEKQ